MEQVFYGGANPTAENGHVKELLKNLFDKILSALLISGALGVDEMPNFFIVYAHRDKKNTADGDAGVDLVIELIENFELAGCKARSDRMPVLNLTDTAKDDYAAKHIVLENQFCLLPRKIALKPVDKVIIVASKVLSRYCLDKDGKEYMETLQGRIEAALDPTLTSPEARAMIQEIVDMYAGGEEEGFHHVLTEIAMVASRTLQDKNPHTILPLLLQGTKLETLPFLPKTQHYLRARERSRMVDPTLQVLHFLFFDVLDNIYDQKSNIFMKLVDMYFTACKKLKTSAESRNVPLVEYLRILNQEVLEELSRGRKYEPLDANKPFAKDWFVFDEPVIEVPAAALRPIVLHPKPSTPLSHRQQGYLRLLAFSEMDYHINTIQPAAKGTLDWVPRHPSYQNWMKERSGMLGVRGKPGSGKTTVLKDIILRSQEEFKTKGPDEDRLFLFFFFHQRGAYMERSRLGMFRALLYQLLQKVPMAGHQFWYWIEQKTTNAQHNEISMKLEDHRNWFLSSLTTASCFYRIIIVVDAIDEADDGDDTRTNAAREVIADLRHISQEMSSIENADGDIRHYVETRLANHLGPDLQNFPAHVVSDMVEHADGVFLWVELVVSELSARYLEGYNMSDGEIQDILRKVPRDLSRTYELIIRDRYKSGEFRILVDWITSAMWPLSLEDLRYAIASDEKYMSPAPPRTELSVGFLPDDTAMSRMVQDLLGGLAEVKQHGNKPRVQFIHQTVLDFFLFDQYSGVRGDRLEQHHRLGKSCGNFIGIESGRWESLKVAELDLIPFCRYAVEHWFKHAKLALENGMPLDDLSQILRPLPDGSTQQLLRRWCKAYVTFYPDSFLTEPTGKEVAAYFGISL